MQVLSGVRCVKGRSVQESVRVSGEAFEVQGRAYTYGARVLQLSMGADTLNVFPLIPALPSVEAWRAWVAENCGAAPLPSPLDCMLGPCVWLAAVNGRPSSLALETWTPCVQRLRSAQRPAPSALLLGVTRNKEAAKVKKGALKAGAATAKRPARARKSGKRGTKKRQKDSDAESDAEDDADAEADADAEEDEEDADDEEDYVEEEEDASVSSGDYESEASTGAESGSEDSEAAASEDGESDSEQSDARGVASVVRIVPDLD